MENSENWLHCDFIVLGESDNLEAEGVEDCVFLLWEHIEHQVAEKDGKRVDAGKAQGFAIEVDCGEGFFAKLVRHCFAEAGKSGSDALIALFLHTFASFGEQESNL